MIPASRTSVALVILALFHPTAPGIARIEAQDSPADQPSTYQQWYEALRSVRPDPQRGASVRGLTLERDAATIQLTSGTIHLLEPIAGRTIGAVFVGEGLYSMMPPTAVEQQQLRRSFDTHALVTPIRSAVLFFTDETAEELSRILDWEERSPPQDAGREIEEALAYRSDDEGWMSRTLMLPLLNEIPDFFYAHVAESRDDPLVFSISPLQFEEISFYRRADGSGEQLELVNQFHWRSDYEGGTSPPPEASDLVQVLGYDITSTIDDDLDYAATASASVVRLDPSVDWIPFYLYWRLEPTAARWGDGSPVTFYRPEESSDLWIDFGSAPTDSSTLTVEYAGDLLDQEHNLWVEVRSSITWFPVYQYGRAIPYRLTFRAPDDYSVVTSGALVSEESEDGTTTSVWETPPIHQVTFNIGEFEDHEVDDPRIPRLRVQIDEGAHSEMQGRASDANLFMLRQGDMADQVMKDLANSFAFYGDVFGEPPVSEFIATEIPYTHGEAYPGLVLLSWVTFQWTDSQGSDDAFRAHEVAHQWWGIGVRPATYHDRWLSEGFADFSGLWYAARARGSFQLLMGRLAEMREEILERRDEAAPIWLGTRVGTVENPGDYQTIVYEKGAWVLHMLRTLLTDPETGDDSDFVALMQDFYTTFRGRSATTEQFIQMANRHAGSSLDWFFRQWVYGSAIPTYHFSYKLDELESGEYRATVRVRQEDVPDDFQMIVPIDVDFGERGTVTTLVGVSGATTEVELPLLPMEPEELIFNPRESVLAETRTEGWQD